MNIEELRKLREKVKREMKLREKNARIRIIVGMATSGIASGARETMNAILDEIEKRDLKDVIVTQSGEKGLHPKEPIVIVEEIDKKRRFVYGDVTPEVGRMIVIEHIVHGKPIQNYIVQIEEIKEE